MSAAAMLPSCGRLLPVLPLRQLMPLLLLPASESPASERGESGAPPSPAPAPREVLASTSSSCPRCRFLRSTSLGSCSRSCSSKSR